jgi:hypothetical protein
MALWTATEQWPDEGRSPGRTRRVARFGGLAHAVAPDLRTRTLCGADTAELTVFPLLDFEGNAVRLSRRVARCPDCLERLPDDRVQSPRAKLRGAARINRPRPGAAR